MSDADVVQCAQIAEVIIDRSVSQLDRAFSYSVPSERFESLVPGMQVEVPLGHGQANGWVVALRHGDASSLKPLGRIVDPHVRVNPVLLELAQWMSQQYLCFASQALRAVLPSSVRRGVRPRRDPVFRVTGVRRGKPSSLQTVWEWLADNGPASRGAVLKKFPKASQTLRTLVSTGTLEVVDTPEVVLPTADSLALNADQERALQQLRANPTGVWLLEGVTGSGKTEVYLQRVADVLSLGGQAAVMVPEIALTPQTVERFRARFGQAVAIWHSQLPDGERVMVWDDARSGRARVVVGARSVVFLPFSRLQLIVLDEEHEATYKQDEHPRYHTRDVAHWRIEREGGQLILGSATPSLETAWRARTGQIGWIQLPNRIYGRALPLVQVVDMREELQEGNRSIFSRALQSQVSDTLAQGRQAILFLNRRGFASFVLCRDCGQSVQCPSCAVTMTYHQTGPAGERLECHYCFRVEAPPSKCPQCQSTRIRFFGAGTERVVEEVQKLWSQARVVRADRDTITTRQGYYDLYDGFRGGQADIMVGTQMIAKGMDFPNVEVVGVVAADTALHLPDFRSAERTFQLLVQASGRAGRGDFSGRVIIQTYNPEHYAVVTAKTHDYHAFYEQELQFRRAVGYPPFQQVWLIEVTGDVDRAVAAQAEQVALSLRAQLLDSHILGPAPAPIARVRNRYRYHILIRSQHDEAVNQVLKTLQSPGSLRITVDPHFML